jgi:hypothetical protein
VLNVVATIDTPMSHHGAARPEVKNSAVLDPARRASHRAGANEIATDAATMVQSSDVSCRMPSVPGGYRIPAIAVTRARAVAVSRVHRHPKSACFDILQAYEILSIVCAPPWICRLAW